MYEDNFGKEGIDKATEIILKNDGVLSVFETYQLYPLLGKRYSVHNMAKLVSLIEAQKNSDISSEQQEEFVELVRYINDTLGEAVSEDKSYNFFFDKDDISGKLRDIEEKCENLWGKWGSIE